MNIKCQLFIVLVLSTIAYSQATKSNKLEEGFLKLFEKWRKGDVGSLPIALPTLPLKLSPSVYEHDGFRLSVGVARVEGVQHMTVTQLTASNSSLSLSLNFKIPSVTVLSDWYRLKGRAFIFNIDNDGKFRVDIKDLKVTANLKFGAQGSNTVIKQLNLDFTVGRLKINLSGCPKLVLNKINDKVRKLVHKKSKELMDKIKKKVTEGVNVYLRGKTPDQLMQIISSA